MFFPSITLKKKYFPLDGPLRGPPEAVGPRKNSLVSPPVNGPGAGWGDEGRGLRREKVQARVARGAGGDGNRYVMVGQVGMPKYIRK